MADQDNKSKMAIPNQPKDLARKLVKAPAEDIANYVLGDAAKAGIKKFGAAHPTLRRNQPNMSPKENEDTFDGGSVKDDTTRRADYETGQDEAAYRNGHGETNKEKIKKKVAESVVAMAARKVKVEPVNAQKKGAMSTHGSEHETSEVAGDDTSEPQQKKHHVKIPPQVVTSESAYEKDLQDHEPRKVQGVYGTKSKSFEKKFKNQKAQDAFFDHPTHAGNYEVHYVSKMHEAYLSELGEPMAPAPATSDSPGWSGQSSSSDQPGMGKDGSNKNTDSDAGDDDSDEGADETVTAARDNLEVIATQAAELYENIEDNAKLPDWVLEKLELAKNFVNSVAKHISDTKDEDSDDEDDDGSENKDNTDTAKPTAFKNNGEQALAKEEVLSAKAGRAGKDLGKPGKSFAMIAAKAGKKYGSKESGEKVAGAILAKIRKAHGVK